MRRIGFVKGKLATRTGTEAAVTRISASHCALATTAYVAAAGILPGWLLVSLSERRVAHQASPRRGCSAWAPKPGVARLRLLPSDDGKVLPDVRAPAAMGGPSQRRGFSAAHYRDDRAPLAHGVALCWSYQEAVATLIDWQILQQPGGSINGARRTTSLQNGHYVLRGHVQYPGHLFVGCSARAYIRRAGVSGMEIFHPKSAAATWQCPRIKYLCQLSQRSMIKAGTARGVR